MTPYVIYLFGFLVERWQSVIDKYRRLWECLLLFGRVVGVVERWQAVGERAVQLPGLAFQCITIQRRIL